MRLISCHIENFGILSEVDFDFTSGLNKTVKENGWGKSTLSSFIKVMFYGLENDRSLDEIVNERKRYQPWQGGVFGGRITFEVQGRRYTITRSFGQKASLDTFELRNADTNMVVNDFSENIGEELFHINGESFAKTIFIKQSDCFNAGTSDDINAKLGNISDGIDLNRYTIAKNILKSALNEFSPTGKKGEISRMKSRASELKKAVEAGKGLKSAIDEVESRITASKDRIEDLKHTLEELSDKKKVASEASGILKDKALYEELKSDVTKLEQAYREMSSVFKSGFPSKETCEEWEQAISDLKSYTAVLERTKFLDSENALYTSMLTTFRESTPSFDKIDGLIEEANRLNGLRKISQQYSFSDKEGLRYSELHEKYENAEEAEEKLNDIIKALNLRTSYATKADYLEKELDKREALLSKNHNSKPGMTFLMVLGMLLIVAGCSMFAINLYGIIDFSNSYMTMWVPSLLIVGFISFVWGFVAKKTGNGSLKDQQEELDELNREYEDILNLMEDIDRNVYKFSSKYHLDVEQIDDSKGLNQIFNEIFEFKALSSRKFDAALNNHNEECNRISAEISDFLKNYGYYCPENEYPEKLTELRAKSLHFDSLKLKAEQCTEARAKIHNIKDNLREQLRFYGVDPGMDVAARVDDLLDLVLDCNNQKNKVSDAKERLDEFERNHNLSILLADTDKESISFDEISEKEKIIITEIEKLRDKLEIDVRTRDGYLASYEEWQSVEDELSLLLESIDEKLIKYAYLEKTEQFMSDAKEKLTARYMEPLMKSFSLYYGILTGNSGDNYKIDANTVITKEEKGSQRSTRTLSYGYQDLIGFCTRLAIADAMYAEEKPMLILDDPFVNLDDEKFSGALKLLEVMAEDYQIIYLTCRENRL